jgi:predicted metal-dependent enzyme (double-stranded beta helix superfamily)
MGTTLRTFVTEATDIVDRLSQERDVLTALKAPFAALVAQDDWLPDAFAQPHPKYYQQYLLHCDPRQRFSVVSFVWGPGQVTPVHDHTVWGMIGVLRGAELSTRFAPPVAGEPMQEIGTDRLEAGMIDVVSPDIGDYHQVSNAFDDHVSISIHVYGANIGAVRRHVFDRRTGTAKEFVSGFSSDMIPNIWA